MARNTRQEYDDFVAFLRVDWRARFNDKRQPVREMYEQAKQIRDEHPLFWAMLRDVICEVGGFHGHPDTHIAAALAGRTMAFLELERLAGAPTLSHLVGEVDESERASR